MEISKNVLVIFALAVTLILETRTFDEYSRIDLPENHDEHFLPHTRQRREALSDQRNYTVDIIVNVSDAEEYQKILFALNATSFPIHLSNNTEIIETSVTTVCFSTGSGFKCNCAKQFAWSYNNCVTYGACDSISSGICKCINAIPPDGQSCRPISELLAQVEYEVEVELNVTDIETLNHLRSLLINGSYFLALSPIVNITHINITTVCSMSNDGFQCRCEDQYRWSCDQCLKYGSCDNITDDTCGCINAFFPDGLYCQSVYQHNFTACPLTTTLPPTTPPVVNECLITVELNTTDIIVVETLRTILSNISYSIIISDQIQVSDINFTTACYPNGSTYQCRCEEPYSWPCHLCSTSGKCNDVFENTCGCINTIPPGGVYCQLLTEICPSPPLPTATLGPIQSTTTTSSTTPTRIPTTSVPTAAPTSPTPLPTTTTNPATSPTPVTTTTIATPATTPPTVINVTMSVRLDLEFTEDLTDKSTPAYKELESGINSVLQEQYNSISGVRRAFVTGFRPGSVITDFVVQAIEVNAREIAEANNNLPSAMESLIAPVLGSVVAQYTSPTSLRIPGPIYTGQTVMLTCGPPDIDVGTISGSVWKFEGLAISSDRIIATTAGSQSTLMVNNIIPADAGLYECTMEGTDLRFVQTGKVTEIIEAPIVRLQSKVSVKCEEGDVPLQCCVQSPYTVRWFDGINNLASSPTEEAECIQHNYQIENCNSSQTREEIFTCRVNELEGYDQTTTLTVFIESVECNNTQYGTGREGDTASARCDAGQEGEKIARCQNRQWRLVQDTCILVQIRLLLIGSQDLALETVPEFVGNLSAAVRTEAAVIPSSPATISAIVDILNNVANLTTVVNENVMEDLLETVDVIIGDDSRESWLFLNSNQTNNASSGLLGSLETLSNGLNGTFIIETQRIQLNRTMFTDSFNAMLNSSVAINIPNTNFSNVFITTIILSTFNNVMPVRNSSFDVSLLNATTNETVPDNAINAAVLLVKITESISNVTLSYNKLNESLSLNPQCVFWNFTFFDGLGAWDDEGCTFVSDINNTVTCSCNHLTSFSILMATDIPPSIRSDLEKITYAGVGISLASLVICLIIEGYVWKEITRNSTAFMRHVSIINTALSLLIANICFMIGASIAKNPLEDDEDDYTVPVGPCSTATFFMHFFYLALFFWMLVSGLLLFYRTVMVFSHMSKSTMLAIGLILGYGCPLIIAVITVAVTAPGNGYIRKNNACWLNWFETKALLAMVIPALTIVFINILIVIVVLFKMLRRGMGDTAQTDGKHTMVVIIRCVAILTPLFGLTWSLGVGTMISPTNAGIHIAFAFFNSLQGFFILVFGTLMDSKIRAILSKSMPRPASGSNQTRSTSGGISSFSGMNLINRLRGRKSNLFYFKLLCCLLKSTVQLTLLLFVFQMSTVFQMLQTPATTTAVHQRHLLTCMSSGSIMIINSAIKTAQKKESKCNISEMKSAVKQSCE
uniref:Adhesion G protein-coupled receptor F5-like n=1 Tax=Amphiprion percula TaxID=161767 RepID=A0A3P8S3K3_AMPPE